MDNCQFGVVALFVAAHASIEEKDFIPDFKFCYPCATGLNYSSSITAQNERQAIGVKTTLAA